MSKIDNADSRPSQPKAAEERSGGQGFTKTSNDSLATRRDAAIALFETKLKGKPKAPTIAKLKKGTGDPSTESGSAKAKKKD